MSTHSPALVFSCPRTGSTLLRILLDSHPQIYCPDELLLGNAARILYELCEGFVDPTDARVTESHFKGASLPKLTARGEQTRRHNPVVLARVGKILRELLDNETLARGKQMWIEKTPDTVFSWDLLADMFPDARFICLHRNPLDVAKSMLDRMTVRFTPLVFKYGMRCQNNSAEAMMLAWADYTEEVLAAEAAHPERSFRIQYESLILEPEESLRKLFAFLAVSSDNTVLERAFTMEHPQRLGHGDARTQFRRGIERDALCVGNSLDWRSMSETTFTRMNGLLERAGYPTLERDGPGFVFGAPHEAPGARATDRVRDLFERQLPSRVESMPDIARRMTRVFKLVVSGEGGGTWILDFSKQPGTVEVRASDGDAQSVIGLATTDLLDLVSGQVNPVALFNQGRIALEGELDLGSLRQLFMLLS